jgi:hypothetical protein
MGVPAEAITAPLVNLNPEWPFELTVNEYPGLKPTSPGGSDHSSFQMAGIPTFNFRTQTDYSYNRAWHTLFDTYSELVPYTRHQEHSAVVTAVVAYGIANLDRPLTRDGVYLPDGLFADITTASGARVITTLDYENAPLQTAYFVRLVEGDGSQPQGGGRGRTGPPLGRIEAVAGGRIDAVIDGQAQLPLVVPDLPLTPNPSVRHDGPGVLGLSGPDRFYLTLAGDGGLDQSFTALGRVIAGADVLGDFAAGEEIRGIRILRSGEAALAFKTDDQTFQALLRRR